MAKGVMNLFLGRKASDKKTVVPKAVIESAAVEKSAKEKFKSISEHYETLYAMSQRSIGIGDSSATRENFLYKLYAKLPDFKHKDAVNYVLDSPKQYQVIVKKFEEMEQFLKQPTPLNLEHFQEAKKSVKNIIDENFLIARRVSRYLLKDDNFCKALVAANNTDSPLRMFQWYYDMSLAAEEYFVDICKLESLTDWRKQTEKRA